jgi:hypothetical protein
MKKISFVFIAALSFAAFGCKKGGGGGSDCDKAINNSMELSKADMAKMPGMDDKMMQKMKDIGIQHCKDDKWPEEVTKCMADAKAMADAQGCYSKLTKEQREAMNKAAMEAMKPAAGAGGAGSAPGGETGSAPAGGAPAGSAEPGAGSAGSAAAPPK